MSEYNPEIIIKLIEKIQNTDLVPSFFGMLEEYRQVCVEFDIEEEAVPFTCKFLTLLGDIVEEVEVMLKEKLDEV